MYRHTSISVFVQFKPVKTSCLAETAFYRSKPNSGARALKGQLARPFMCFQ